MTVTATITIWDKEEGETVLMASMKEYERDDEFIYLSGKIEAEQSSTEQTDPDAFKLVGRHVNIHLPI